MVSRVLSVIQPLLGYLKLISSSFYHPLKLKSMYYVIAKWLLYNKCELVPLEQN